MFTIFSPAPRKKTVIDYLLTICECLKQSGNIYVVLHVHKNAFHVMRAAHFLPGRGLCPGSLCRVGSVSIFRYLGGISVCGGLCLGVSVRETLQTETPWKEHGTRDRDPPRKEHGTRDRDPPWKEHWTREKYPQEGT